MRRKWLTMNRVIHLSQTLIKSTVKGIDLQNQSTMAKALLLKEKKKGHGLPEK